jgi:hypothetical protein
MLANMAVLLLGKTLVNLNYSASLGALLGAVLVEERASKLVPGRMLPVLEHRLG